MIDTNIFAKFNRVAVAVSGGKDSMALLREMICKFDKDFFYVVNIEHGIRGDESVSDSEFVENYCASNGVKCIRYNVDAIAYSNEKGYTLEQGARLLRREIFAREVEENRADRVAVAHHMDDNVESVLMHIFRGSGLRGVKGMVADDGLLLRPLLGVTREDIDRYIDVNKVPFREDSTNSDNAYRRNFIRHDIMPLLRSKYPTIDRNIMRLADAAIEDDEYLSNEAERLIERDGNSVRIVMNAPDVLLKRAIYRAFIMLGVTADVEERHYRLLLDLRNSPNGTSLDMPYGVKVSVEYGYIALFREKDTDLECEHPLVVGDTVLGDYVVNVDNYDGKIDSYEENGYKVLFADADKLSGAVVRTRRTGDMFKRYKGGNKKLKDYFIDIKLPKKNRDIPVLAVGNNVLAVSGVEIGDSVSVDKDTNRIYKITLRRKI